MLRVAHGRLFLKQFLAEATQSKFVVLDHGALILAQDAALTTLAAARL